MESVGESRSGPNADVARFQISEAGALTFKTPPDYENPVDANTNNVYLVTIGVTDTPSRAKGRVDDRSHP